MKTIRKTVGALMIAGLLCFASCGKNNNGNEGAADSLKDTVGTQSNAIDTEMDSVVSPDTIMPAP